jgi:hypothetical protein
VRGAEGVEGPRGAARGRTEDGGARGEREVVEGRRVRNAASARPTNPQRRGGGVSAARS